MGGPTALSGSNLLVLSELGNRWDGCMHACTRTGMPARAGGMSRRSTQHACRLCIHTRPAMQQRADTFPSWMLEPPTAAGNPGLGPFAFMMPPLPNRRLTGAAAFKPPTPSAAPAIGHLPQQPPLLLHRLVPQVSDALCCAAGG